MTDTDKFRQGEVPPEQEDSLESVAGGKFSTPNYDFGQRELKYKCPVCGGVIRGSEINGTQVQCPGCGRQLRFNGAILVEE